MLTDENDLPDPETPLSEEASTEIASQSQRFTSAIDTWQKQIEPEILNTLIKLASVDFYTFVSIMGPSLVPDGYQDGRHIRLICREFQNVVESVEANILRMNKQKPGKTILGEENRKLQVFMPPGSMKTKIVSNLGPAWVLGRHPQWYILSLGHSEKQVQTLFGAAVKDIMSSSLFQKIFPDCKLDPSIRSNTRFNTTKDGRYRCFGANQKVAGERGHLIICDDILSEQDAYSDLKRKTINESYFRIARSRKLPYGAEIIMNTRWHLDDLSGYLLGIQNKLERNKLLNEDQKKDARWRIIRIPAIVDAEASKQLGIPEGSSFWPEYHTISSLMEIRESVPDYWWQAQYMQNPVPVQGGMFQKHLWKQWVFGEPSVDQVVISVDTAYGLSDQGDYTAWTVWGLFRSSTKLPDGRKRVLPNAILLEAGRDKGIGFPDLVREIKQLWRTYSADLIIVEQKSAGVPLIQELQAQGLPAVGYDPKSISKVQRAHAVSPLLVTGSFWVDPSDDFTPAFLDELAKFPGDVHDDWVDTFTQFALWFRNYQLVTVEDETRDFDDEEFLERDSSKTWSKPKGVSYWNTRVV